MLIKLNYHSGEIDRYTSNITFKELYDICNSCLPIEKVILQCNSEYKIMLFEVSGISFDSINNSYRVSYNSHFHAEWEIEYDGFDNNADELISIYYKTPK